MRVARIIRRNVSPATPVPYVGATFLGSFSGTDLWHVSGGFSILHGAIVTTSATGETLLPAHEAAGPKCEGSVYALAVRLAYRFAASGHPSAWGRAPFTPNAYSAEDRAECKGCEDCDGEGGHAIAC